MYLSAFVVAMSTWGAISSVRPLRFYSYKLNNFSFGSHFWYKYSKCRHVSRLLDFSALIYSYTQQTVSEWEMVCTVWLMSKPASSSLETTVWCPLLAARCSGDLAVMTCWSRDDDVDSSVTTVSMRPYCAARSRAVSDLLLVMWTSAWCCKPITHCHMSTDVLIFNNMYIFPTHCGGIFGPIRRPGLLFSGRSRSENLGCLWRQPWQHLSLPTHLSVNPATQLHSASSELLQRDPTGWWPLEFDFSV